MTDPYNRAYTYGHDWAGGATLTETATGRSVYFQPGDDARAADAQFEALCGACGYSGQTTLAMMWSDYSDCATAAAAR